MANESQGHQHGPIRIVPEELFGNPKDFEGDMSSEHDGIAGYPAGTGGKAPEVTFINEGAFGKIPEAKREKE